MNIKVKEQTDSLMKIEAEDGITVVINFEDFDKDGEYGVEYDDTSITPTKAKEVAVAFVNTMVEDMLKSSKEHNTTVEEVV